MTTNSIAAKAGVSIGSVYQYFRNKEAIIEEVRRRYVEEFQARMFVLIGEVDSLPLAAAAARFVRALITLHVEDPGLHNALSSGGLGAGERRVIEQLIASWLEGHQDQVRRPNRRLAATVALEAGEALVHGVALRSPELLADPAFGDEVTDLLVRYLAK